jgi:6-pyruvoyltetrahydropterin/6-carboxytetrahydropterin synthase
MKRYTSTKIIELGSCAFRQWRAVDTHCKYVHGYQLKAKFWFEGELDDRNWVVNFGGLKELKSTLQKTFDHTLCIAMDDPEIALFQKLHEVGACDLRIMADVGIEKTAEYCFKRAAEYIDATTNGRCKVTKVEVWEHEANSAIFTETTIS